jgi:hypothetical protein
MRAFVRLGNLLLALLNLKSLIKSLITLFEGKSCGVSRGGLGGAGLPVRSPARS